MECYSAKKNTEDRHRGDIHAAGQDIIIVQYIYSIYIYTVTLTVTFMLVCMLLYGAYTI